MIEQLVQWDYVLFELINQTFSTAFFDQIAPYWRNKYFWVPLYLYVLVNVYLYDSKWWLVVAGIGITVMLSDQASSSWIKESVQRIRPCNNPIWKETINILAPCRGSFSFTSSHATNHFAVASFFITMYGSNSKMLSIIGLLWALTISLGQVYVGLHYPLDIFAGGILGILIGFAVAQVVKQLKIKVKTNINEL